MQIGLRCGKAGVSERKRIRQNAQRNAMDKLFYSAGIHTSLRKRKDDLMTRYPSTRITSYDQESSGTDASARILTLLAGAGVAAFGLTRKSATRIAMMATGATIAAFGAFDAGEATSKTACSSAESSIIVNVPRERAYAYWRDFANFPNFMHHLKSVQVTDGRHSRWTAYGPMAKEIEWDAEITEERENERIAWRSIEGSDVEMEGSVEFTEATGRRGTLIKIEMRYSSPGGGAGQIAMKLFGKDPSFLIRQDIRRFKALLETGEVPTTEGQSHGPRSAVSNVFQAINLDEPVKKGPGRTNAARRRVS
jgi:uncharacterized membrane protein